MNNSSRRLSYVLVEMDVVVVETNLHHLYIDVMVLADLLANSVAIDPLDERVMEVKERHFLIWENPCL